MIMNTDFFDVCGVVRDSFVKDMKKAREKAEKERTEIKRNMIPGSALHRERTEKAAAEFTQAAEKAEEKARRDIESAYQNELAKMQAYVSAVKLGADVSAALDRLEGLPVSKAEFDLLCASCGGSSYWVDRKLEQIAERNGILSPAVAPTYTEKLAILDQTKGKMLDFIEKGDTEALVPEVSDKALRKYESDYSNGFVGYSDVSSDKKAELLLDKAKLREDPFSVAVFCKNLLESETDALVRAALVRRMSEDNSFWGSVRELGGLGVFLKAEGKQKAEGRALVVSDDLAADVAKLTEAEKAAALFGSSLDNGNIEGAESKRRIDRAGLDFIQTEEGREMVKRYEEAAEKAAENVNAREREKELANGID